MIAVRVDYHAGHAGAHCRGERNHDAEDAHGRAAALGRKSEHQGGHDQRHAHACARGLQQSSHEQNGEIDRPSGKRAAQGEHGHRDGEQRARLVAVGQVGGHGHHDGVDQGEPGCQPLCHGGVNPCFCHDGGQGGGHNGLVKNGDEGAKHHDCQHQKLLAGELQIIPFYWGELEKRRRQKALPGGSAATTI